MEQLLIAAVARVKDQLSFSDAQCGIQPDGQPPAACGETYCAISPGEIGLDDPEAEAFEAAYSIIATLTMKAGKVPGDRAGVNLIAKAAGGLMQLSKRIIIALHMSYTVISNASAALPAEQPFVEPLRFLGTSRPMPKRADWFHADPSKGAAVSGWAIEIRFGKCRRYEVLPDADHD